MTGPTLHDKPFLDALGGGTAIADFLTAKTGEKIDREAVYKWPTQGIPHRWRPYLKFLAETKGVVLPPGFLPDFTAPSKPGESA
jgi:hypothetical protein